MPVRMASSAAEALVRSIGTWPLPPKNTRCATPLGPVPVKYSALARKVTRRRSDSGMNTQSAADRWLLAMIAAPLAGTWPIPSTRGRNTSLATGPTATYLRNQ